MLGEEILIEIDATLESLIENAEAIQRVDVTDLLDHEIDSFQKTQESLIHHLIALDEKLESKRKKASVDKRSACFKIQEKRSRFEGLKRSYQAHFNEAKTKQAIICKRRRKKLLAFL